MPKRTDISKILVIGSGPIVIGQAAEFDYAGTQACLALREEGYEVVLCNSNPATIMTDTTVADKVYMEPLNLEYLAKIIRYERPDAIVPGIGGQTGLNLAMQLEAKGVLRECGAELLGTQFRLINGFGAGYGFDGVAMALIGQLHPIATMVVALFFAVLRVGSTTMQAATGVPTSVSDIIQALVIVFSVAGMALTKLPEFQSWKSRVFGKRKAGAV